MNNRICWITWENHRRSIELSSEIGADYNFIKSSEIFILRHFLKAIKTIRIIYRYRNDIVIVQNPSRILAALAAFMKIFLPFTLIVDRHTNFRLGKGLSFNPAIWFVVLCSEFSLKVADLTIVTNEYLKKLVERKGGRAIVLHDKIPNFDDQSVPVKLPVGINVLFVCTYAADEPFREVFKAVKLLPEGYNILVTGNYCRAGIDNREVADNLKLLGFVSTEAYEAYIKNCDIVMVLTTSDWCIVCGGYEAMAAGRPLITSNTKALQEFYGNSACYVAPDSQSIAAGIVRVSTDMETYSNEIAKERNAKEVEWQSQWAVLAEYIYSR